MIKKTKYLMSLSVATLSTASIVSAITVSVVKKDNSIPKTSFSAQQHSLNKEEIIKDTMHNFNWALLQNKIRNFGLKNINVSEIKDVYEKTITKFINEFNPIVSVDNYLGNFVRNNTSSDTYKYFLEQQNKTDMLFNEHQTKLGSRSVTYINPKLTPYEIEMELERQSKNIMTMSLISSASAAGFWAAAWWFGISIPWATACTTAAAGYWTEYIVIESVRIDYSNFYYKNWSFTDLYNAGVFINDLKNGLDIVRTVKNVVKGIRVATGWANLGVVATSWIVENALDSLTK